LLGSWNEWQPIEMQRCDDGIWRVEVALPDGEYEYKFQLISKSGDTAGRIVSVADPKAIQFARDSDSSNMTVARVENGKRVNTTYQWHYNDRPLPPNEQLIIYEMHLGDFRGGPGDVDDEQGDFRRVLEKLDYLADLGVNALQLMPVRLRIPMAHPTSYAASLMNVMLGGFVSSTMLSSTMLSITLHWRRSITAIGFMRRIPTSLSYTLGQNSTMDIMMRS
jgi:1,4-alpha-glucan branching enzyme